jgi:hypothetical protein
MTSLLIDKLHTQKQILKSLLKSGRKDAVAKIVMNRVAQEIHQLQKEIAHEQGKEAVKHKATSGFAQGFIQAVRRFWSYCHGDHHAVHSISQNQALQEKRGST